MADQVQEEEINIIMKKVAFILTYVSLTMVGFGQVDAIGYFEDALRFSRSNYSLGSTSRMQSIGGASVSLGGDISSAVSNPAGLGFFNKSTFTLSPTLNFSNVETDFSIGANNLGRSNELFANSFNFANVGAVINWNKGRFTNDEFKGGSLAISINRAGNYKLKRFYEGENRDNSLTDALAINAGVLNSDNLDETSFAAFDQYLISQDVDENENILRYFSEFEGASVQNETLVDKGYHYQLNIAWGGNYDDRFYFGGGIGLQFLNYRQRKTYYELPVADPSLRSFSVVDDLKTEGTGINFNLGAIARLIPFITIGVSYTSPSFLSFDEKSFLDVDADWLSGSKSEDGKDISDIDPYKSALFVSSYNLRTPSRLGAGATLFIGKSGFLTGDIEWVNYSDMIINTNDFSPSADNRAIKNVYSSVLNVRVGGEYRIQQFMLRAGYALFPSPYADNDFDKTTNITFGLGYRTSDYFVDFVAVSSERSIQYFPYFISENQPVAVSDIGNIAVTATFGINF